MRFACSQPSGWGRGRGWRGGVWGAWEVGGWVGGWWVVGGCHWVWGWGWWAPACGKPCCENLECLCALSHVSHTGSPVAFKLVAEEDADSLGRPDMAGTLESVLAVLNGVDAAVSYSREDVLSLLRLGSHGGGPEHPFWYVPVAFSWCPAFTGFVCVWERAQGAVPAHGAPGAYPTSLIVSRLHVTPPSPTFPVFALPSRQPFRACSRVLDPIDGTKVR